MTEKLSVALVGIPEREKGYFDQVVRFSKSRNRAYELWRESTDVAADLVVANDEPSALERAREMMEGRSTARLVILSNRGSSNATEHVLKRPLLISRVLRVLDQASAAIPQSLAQSEPNVVSFPGAIQDLQPVPKGVPAGLQATGKPEGTDSPAPAPRAADRPPRPSVPEAAPRPRISTQGPQPVKAWGFGQPARATEAAPARKVGEEGPQPATAWTARQRQPVVKTAPAPEARDEQSKVAQTWTTERRSPVAKATPLPGVLDAEPAPARAFVAEQASPAPEAAPTPEVAPEDSKSGYRALVVDDSLPIRKQLEIELGQAGIMAEYAETGERALEMIEEHQFDLVFLDIMMPGIDGYEVCKRLRKIPEHKKTPIIMLSGKTSPLDEVQGVLAGATTYLTKPINHDGFQSVLGRVVKWLGDFRPGG